jgi:hypothetical protein
MQRQDARLAVNALEPEEKQLTRTIVGAVRTVSRGLLGARITKGVCTEGRSAGADLSVEDAVLARLDCHCSEGHIGTDSAELNFSKCIEDNLERHRSCALRDGKHLD